MTGVCMAYKYLKRLLVCFPLLLASFLISCGKDPGSPATVSLRDLQRPIVMKDIPAGTFTMGSIDTANHGAQPPHQVTLSAFRMQETEVTQEQYLAVMDTNPASFDTGAMALRPVEQVSWHDAVLYCNALSKLSGLTQVYDTTTWSADFTKTGYRLPTEAEWEYACRAGSTTTYWWGPAAVGMSARTWSGYNSDYTTHPVAEKKANAFGLYDMAGNVFELCNDWYGGYSAAVAADPTGAASGTNRVLRGGSWFNGDIDLRSANRLKWGPGSRRNDIGFRCVCSLQ
jgi:formylglycine-generating enzyme required for sulfatase activity